MDNKEFTNQELKKIITNLHINNNIPINEELKKNLSQSSRTQYKTLIKYYYDIKNSLVEEIILNKEEETIQPTPTQTSEIKEIDNIKEDEKSKIILDLRTKNFTQKCKISNYKYKILCYKKEIKRINNKKIIIETKSQISTSDDEEKEYRKIKYNQLPELSSYNIIQELQKLSFHNLKQVYNKYFSNKIKRQFSINN